MGVTFLCSIYRSGSESGECIPGWWSSHSLRCECNIPTGNDVVLDQSYVFTVCTMTASAPAVCDNFTVTLDASTGTHVSPVCSQCESYLVSRETKYKVFMMLRHKPVSELSRNCQGLLSNLKQIEIFKF